MVNQHFFKPLLHDFHSHLTIPTAFFLKYTKGRKEEKKVKLRTDVSKITWEVKIEDGGKLTDGWKEFALAHDLRNGDILIFRQEEDKDLAFHVTLLGPSSYEIQYDSCLDDKNNHVNKVKKKKKSPIRQAKSSSSLDPSLFVSNVLASTLRYDTQYFPKRFVRENGLEKGCGKIVLMNEKGTPRTLDLRQKPSSGIMYMTSGWRPFCKDNKLRAGSSFTFKLIKGGSTLVLRMSTTKNSSNEEINLEKKHPKRKKRVETKSSSLDPSCFVAYVSPATLRYDKVNFPRGFAREHGLNNRSGKIVLVNQNGKPWTVDLKGKSPCGAVYIIRGWIRFCRDNGLKAGSYLTFKLIRKGETLALRLLSESKDDEIESLSTEQESDEESTKDERSVKKCRTSLTEKRFVTLTLKEYFIKKRIMFLPTSFTRMNNINEETEMKLVDKNGVEWSTKLRSEDRGDRKRLVGGWRDFFKGNDVEIGESVMLELIWEDDTSCILKFCSKVRKRPYED